MLNLKLLQPIVLITLLSVSGSGFAADDTSPTAKHHKHNIVSHQTERSKTDAGFIRTTTIKDDKGATAIHRADVVADKAAGTRTSTLSGNTLDGKTYTGHANSKKTDTGYVSQEQITTSDGKTMSRDVTGTIDKSAGTLTKDTVVTNADGKTKTKTKVLPLRRHG